MFQVLSLLTANLCPPSTGNCKTPLPFAYTWFEPLLLVCMQQCFPQPPYWGLFGTICSGCLTVNCTGCSGLTLREIPMGEGREETPSGTWSCYETRICSSSASTLGYDESSWLEGTSCYPGLCQIWHYLENVGNCCPVACQVHLYQICFAQCINLQWSTQSSHCTEKTYNCRFPFPETLHILWRMHSLNVSGHLLGGSQQLSLLHDLHCLKFLFIILQLAWCQCPTTEVWCCLSSKCCISDISFSLSQSLSLFYHPPLKPSQPSAGPEGHCAPLTDCCFA